jgi:hypothetical protein
MRKIDLNTDDQVRFIVKKIAIAQTKYGKVLGLLLKSIYHFSVITYGVDTRGKNQAYATINNNTMDLSSSGCMLGKFH